jgi:hypothetical protein
VFDVTLRNWQRQSAVRQRGAEDFRPAQWPGCVTDKAALTAAIRTIRGQAAHANKMATRPATVRHTSPNTYTIAASAKGKLSSQNRISPREPRGELTCFRGLVCIAVVQIQSYRARACRLLAPASKRALLAAAASRAMRLHAVNCSTLPRGQLSVSCARALNFDYFLESCSADWHRCLLLESHTYPDRCKLLHPEAWRLGATRLVHGLTA